MIAKISWISEEFTKQEVKDCLKPIRHNFEIAVYGTDNYFNLGAIIRTAHNFLAKGIYAVDLNGFYEKASMGARKYEDVTKVDLDGFLAGLNGKPLIVFERRPELNNAHCLYDFKWPENPVMFFGNEKFGVPEKALETAHSVVSISVYGLLHDFNVSNAASIAMYDWMNKNYHAQR